MALNSSGKGKFPQKAPTSSFWQVIPGRFVSCLLLIMRNRHPPTEQYHSFKGTCHSKGCGATLGMTSSVKRITDCHVAMHLPMTGRLCREFHIQRKTTTPVGMVVIFRVSPLCRYGFLYDHIAVYQIGAFQIAFDGNGALHQIRQDHHAVFAGDLHNVFHGNGFRLHFILVYSRKTHRQLLTLRPDWPALRSVADCLFQNQTQRP